MSIVSVHHAPSVIPKSQSFLPWAAAISIFIMIVWPTYFLFGVSELNISVPRLLMSGWVFAFAALAADRRRREALGIRLDELRTVFVLFSVWTVWRIACDI